MPTSEHRCEACNEVVGSSRRTRTAIGRPFGECPRCGGFVERAPYVEWPSLSPTDRLKYIASNGAFALAAGLLPALIVAVGSIVMGRSLGRMTLLLLGAIGLVIGGALWIARLTAEVRRSRTRLADPMYRAKLMEFEMHGRESSEPV